jgi:hypothetical protein
MVFIQPKKKKKHIYYQFYTIYSNFIIYNSKVCYLVNFYIMLTYGILFCNVGHDPFKEIGLLEIRNLSLI